MKKSAPTPRFRQETYPSQPSESNISNVLIFSFSHIGDAVLSTVVISPLREHFPNARIDVLVGPVAKEAFRGDVRVNDVIVYDNRGVHAGLSGKSRLIKELRGRQFDLVISDLGMPGMDGNAVAQKIKEIDRDIPFFLLSGWGNLTREKIEADPNIDAVLGKPLKMTELERLLQDITVRAGK